MKTHKLTNVKLIDTNFKGREDRFSKGHRFFYTLLKKDDYEALSSKGFDVRPLYEVDNDFVGRLRVKLVPQMMLPTVRTNDRPMGLSELEQMDQRRNVYCDLEIATEEVHFNGHTFLPSYLTSINFTSWEGNVYKFLSREKALTVINNWIADGSKLESWGGYSEAEWVVLRGKDGAREELYIFHDEQSYNDAVDFTPWED